MPAAKAAQDLPRELRELEERDLDRVAAGRTVGVVSGNKGVTVDYTLNDGDLLVYAGGAQRQYRQGQLPQ